MTKETKEIHYLIQKRFFKFLPYNPTNWKLYAFTFIGVFSILKGLNSQHFSTALNLSINFYCFFLFLIWGSFVSIWQRCKKCDGYLHFFSFFYSKRTSKVFYWMKSLFYNVRIDILVKRYIESINFIYFFNLSLI